MFLISTQKHTLKNIPLGWHHFWGSELNKEQAALWIVFTVKGGWIRHLLSLSSCYALKGDLLKVCGWVLMWSTFGLLACLCVCSAMPTGYITLLHLQADFYLSISLGDSLAWHPRLSISTWQQLESNLETCHSFLMRRHYKPNFPLTWGTESPPCSWWPLIFFSAIYFQSLMRWCVCGWDSSLGAPAWPLFMWSGPTWSGIWPGPVGPRLGAVSWSAASLECQTFEVRLVKKEQRVVGVSSNMPLCLK